MKYTNHINLRKTPQSEQASPNQVKNSAGGYSFAVDDWKRLERFLILGNEGGSYYASEKTLTKENCKSLQTCLKQDYVRAIDTIVNVSDEGRAPKNDPAIFALAVAASSENPATRQYALQNLNKVCRIGTHLLQFTSELKNLRGVGRGVRSAISNWYTSKNPDQLAYQALKYQSRGGMSHRDVLRLAHVSSPEHNSVLRWIVSGAGGTGPRTVLGKNGKQTREYSGVDTLPALLTGYEKIKAATTVKEVVSLIDTYKFTHEMVPNEWKNTAEVWEAMLDHMPYTAMIRNLGKMTEVGLLKPLSQAGVLVSTRLNDFDAIKKARVHPLSILVAAKTYSSGRGVKGSLVWTPNQKIVDSLDDAFYGSFKTVEPTNLAHLLAVDVSGSMSGPGIAGVANMSPREASAAMALFFAKTEPNYHVFGFSSKFVDLNISAKDKLPDALRKVSDLPFRGTDCALPMIYAKTHGLKVDAFSVFTDSETWFGQIHPHQALREYRNQYNPKAKLAVFGMVSNGFSIADPNDAGQMDFVGFDTNAPSVFADFVQS